MADSVQVTFGAKIDELVSGMEQMSSSVQDQLDKMNASMKGAADQSKQAAEDMKKSNEQAASSFQALQKDTTAALNSVKSAISTCMGALAGITALLAGGALFKGAVDSTIKWDSEVSKLSRTLGVNMRAASDLNVALRLVGTDAETYTGALTKLERQLRTNEGGLQALGMATRDAYGNLVDGETAMRNALATMTQYKQGLDQGIVSQQLFGRGADQIAPLLRLNNEITARAAQMAKDFGLEVGTNDVKAMRAYQVELNSAKLALDSLEQKIGVALMAVLEKMAWFLTSTLTDATEKAKGKIGELHTSVEGLTGALEKALKAWDKFVGESHHSGSIKYDANGVPTAPGGELRYEKGKGVQYAPGYSGPTPADELDKGPSISAGQGQPGGGLDQTAGPGGNKRVQGATFDLAAAQEELTQLKNKQENWDTWSAADDAKFWAKKLQMTRTGSAEAVSVYDKMMAAYKAEHTESQKTGGGSGGGSTDLVAQWAEQIQRIKDSQKNLTAWSTAQEYSLWNQKLAETKAGSDTWWAIWEKMADMYRQMVAEQTKAAEQQAKNAQAISKGAAAMQRSDSETAIKIKEEQVNQQYRLGQISASQQYSQLKALYDQQYQLEIDAYNKELAELQKSGDKTLAQQVKVWEELERAQNAHQLKSRKDLNQYIEEEKKQYESYATQVGNTFTEIAFHHKSLLQTMQGLEEKFFSYIITSLLKKLVDGWLAGEATRTEATGAAVTARTGAEVAGASTSLIAQGGAMIKSILGSAAETFAGIFGFLSPVMGPAAAGPAAAGEGVVMSMASLVNVSAAGGYDVPPGVSGLMRYHEREMMLPASLADRVRDMTEPGGGRGGDMHVHNNIQATDASSFKGQLRRSNSELNRLLKRSIRDFHLPLKR